MQVQPTRRINKSKISVFGVLKKKSNIYAPSHEMKQCDRWMIVSKEWKTKSERIVLHSILPVKNHQLTIISVTQILMHETLHRVPYQ
jgi:hypothetical protein